MCGGAVALGVHSWEIQMKRFVTLGFAAGLAIGLGGFGAER